MLPQTDISVFAKMPILCADIFSRRWCHSTSRTLVETCAAAAPLRVRATPRRASRTRGHVRASGGRMPAYRH